MKKLLFLLVFFIVASCAIKNETNVSCWQSKVCVNDIYVYNQTPNHQGGVYVTNVQVINFKGNKVLIRTREGHEHWVKVKDFDKHAKPVHTRMVRGNKHH